MKKAFLMSLVLVIGFMFTIGNSYAQEKQKKIVETKAVAIAKTRGSNPNIVTPKPKDDVQVAKQRGPHNPNLCTVWLDNRTGYSVDIYIDGVFNGTLGPYADSYTLAIPGKTRFYGCSIGGTQEWGPYYFDCDYQYTWHLNN